MEHGLHYIFYTETTHSVFANFCFRLSPSRKFYASDNAVCIIGEKTSSESLMDFFLHRFIVDVKIESAFLRANAAAQ